METLKCAISLLKKNAWMTVLDLKDAYYSVPITLEHRTYLKLYFQGQLYCFTCLPNGLSCAPRIFTKLLKPVFATLRSQGHLSVSYIDDVFLQADTLAKLCTNIHVTTKLLLNLGFVIHVVMSTFSGTRTQPFVGYILDTDHMVVRLTDEKINKRVNACNTMITSQLVSIRDVSHLLGLIVSAFPAAEFGPLYYRSIEIERNRALQISKGDYDSKMSLSAEDKSDIIWWRKNVATCQAAVFRSEPCFLLRTDSSKEGWGAVHWALGSDSSETTGGRWNPLKAKEHINYLELKAIQFALQSFFDKEKCVHIKIKCDNVTAVSYLRKMGGVRSALCNALSREV